MGSGSLTRSTATAVVSPEGRLSVPSRVTLTNSRLMTLSDDRDYPGVGTDSTVIAVTLYQADHPRPAV